MTVSLNENQQTIPPSPWVVGHLAHITQSGRVLDLACGSGRHARLLASRGYQVMAVDRNAQALAGLSGLAGVKTAELDLEGEEWPLAGQHFAGIVVTNYLWRPRLPDLMALLAPGGVLIYETFMLGNEAFGKPSNPEFLLRPQANCARWWRRSAGASWLLRRVTSSARNRRCVSRFALCAIERFLLPSGQYRR
jgi:SAM-dependent methyltransferase